MFFEKDIDIPANTARIAPVTVRLRLKVGIIHYVAVQFPKGCAGQVHIQLFEGGNQVFPTTPGTSIKSSGFIVDWSDANPVQKGGTLWLIKGWNVSSENPHTVSVRFAILEEDKLFPLWRMFKSITAFLRLFRKRPEGE